MGINDRGLVAAATVGTSARGRRGRLGRGLAALVLSAGVALGAGGCGFDVQTLQPYTPAEGVNVEVGGERRGDVAVRNLLVLADEQGSGFLSAAVYAPAGEDTLESVSGFPILADGTVGPPLTIEVPTGMTFAPEDDAVVLTSDRPAITVEGEDMQPGLTVELTLTFSQAGATQPLQVPVVPQAEYPMVSPPAGTPSASPTPVNG